MNNVLMLIVSLEFFSASESIMAAMYLLPLNALLVYYRALSRSWGWSRLPDNRVCHRSFAQYKSRGHIVRHL